MAKHKNPLLEALKEGRSYTWVEPDGGDFASMRAAIKHGQTLTMSPVGDSHEIQVGDIVLVKWRKGHIMHLVHEIRDNQFLIANSVGKINGWVSDGDILGRVTRIIDPEPQPSIPVMLSQLEGAYRKLIAHAQPTADETRRLLSALDDMRWYADRIGAERCDKQPRQNKWSFEQNLWHLTKQVKSAAMSGGTRPICYYIDRGKECVGLAAEIFALFEYDDPDW